MGVESGDTLSPEGCLFPSLHRRRAWICQGTLAGGSEVTTWCFGQPHGSWAARQERHGGCVWLSGS